MSRADLIRLGEVLLVILIGAAAYAGWAEGGGGFAMMVALLSAAALAVLVLAERELAAGHRRLVRRLDGFEGGADRHEPVALASGVDDALERLELRLAARQHAEADAAAPERAMARESPNGLLLVDDEGRIRRHNPALERLLPLQGDPIGQYPVDVVKVPELQEVLEETRRTGAVAERPLHLDGRDLLLRALPLGAESEGTMAMVLDVTTLRRAERARRDFVANVSHELRTPVTAILGYAEALEDDPDLPSGARAMIEVIHRNAHRLQLLVHDVLELSRIEARAADLPLAPQAVLPLVEEVVERLRGQAGAREVRVRVVLDDELRALVNVEAFEHALTNLVDNAIKYNRVGGTVTIEGRSAEDAVEVDVTDDGPGIDPVHHPRIFERFYRGDPARSRAVPGTGLGLAIVKHLCLAMRGEVRFRTAPGAGSTFTLRLPAR